MSMGAAKRFEGLSFDESMQAKTTLPNLAAQRQDHWVTGTQQRCLSCPLIAAAGDAPNACVRPSPQRSVVVMGTANSCRSFFFSLFARALDAIYATTAQVTQKRFERAKLSRCQDGKDGRRDGDKRTLTQWSP
jgi:hypothetical protein